MTQRKRKDKAERLHEVQDELRLLLLDGKYPSDWSPEDLHNRKSALLSELTYLRRSVGLKWEDTDPWHLPSGFAPYNHYPDGKNPVALPRYGIAEGILFSLQRLVPVLPLRAKGKIDHPGWDIPTCWVVDAAAGVWIDNAHGGALAPRTPDDLLAAAETDDERVVIHAALGMKPPRPAWEAAARAAGWTPPLGWTPE